MKQLNLLSCYTDATITEKEEHRGGATILQSSQVHLKGPFS